MPPAPIQRVADRKLAARLTVINRLHPGAEVNIARALNRVGRSGWLLVIGSVVIWTATPPTGYGIPANEATILDLTDIADLDD